MNFRRAQIEDISVMADIRLRVKENVLSRPELITPKMYEDYLEQLGRGWVCELSGQVIGFSYANSVDNSIWALFVLPEFEGMGAGKGLLAHATDWLFQNGAQKITLSTTIGTRADQFLKHRGGSAGR